jgi:hypothetical protein
LAERVTAATQGLHLKSKSPSQNLVEAILAVVTATQKFEEIFRCVFASFRSNEFRKKLPVVVADLLDDEVVQQRVQDGETHRRHTCFLGVGEQRRKIMPWERL